MIAAFGVFLILKYSDRIANLIGDNGVQAVSRVMAIILAVDRSEHDPWRTTGLGNRKILAKTSNIFDSFYPIMVAFVILVG